jgi:hypothetical protein
MASNVSNGPWIPLGYYCRRQPIKFAYKTYYDDVKIFCITDSSPTVFLNNLIFDSGSLF